ncbi:MAG TPA: hypothetical protein VKS44_09565 [Candidatus Acidoferrales bacterium]|nr:hypothetical protein [Candidatus Acidoferrales bacterium]
MPNLDDDRFEMYLKEFRPLAPAPLPLDVPAKPTHSRSAVVAALLATAAAATLVLVMLHRRGSQAPAVNSNSNSSVADLLAISQPLTLGAANQLLVDSPSFEAALDSVEFASSAVAIPRGRESALAVLSEENPKP